ncbi:MAG: tetratricopeptide repeat protein [Acidobacteria bacterium]|nr:tetratricopeptide repeat protein [Acidobacteriota bacterium]
MNRKKRTAAIVLGLILLAGCQKKPRTLPLPPIAAGQTELLAADNLFASGQYELSAEAYEQYLQEFPSADGVPQALLRLGFCYISVSEKSSQAPIVFKQLIENHPGTTYAQEAALLLKLHNDAERSRSETAARDREIERLQKDLQRLKSIDLQPRKNSDGYSPKGE